MWFWWNDTAYMHFGVLAIVSVGQNAPAVVVELLFPLFLIDKTGC